MHFQINWVHQIKLFLCCNSKMLAGVLGIVVKEGLEEKRMEKPHIPTRVKQRNEEIILNLPLSTC